MDGWQTCSSSIFVSKAYTYTDDTFDMLVTFGDMPGDINWCIEKIPNAFTLTVIHRQPMYTVVLALNRLESYIF